MTAAPIIAPSAEVVKVTPKMATAWLEKNTANRRLRQRDVQRYARDMAAKNWRLTGEAIKFDSHGNLADGQHRLHAIVEAGVPVEMFVVRGLAPEVRDVLDTGLKRTASDALAMNGYTNVHLLSAAARLAILWSAGAFRTANQQGLPHVTHAEVLDFVADNDPFIEMVVGRSKWRNHIAARPAVVVFTSWATHLIDVDQSIQFYEDLVELRTAGNGDPRYALLRRLATAEANREKVSAVTESYYFFRAWNAVRKGETLELLKHGNEHGAFKFQDPQ